MPEFRYSARSRNHPNAPPLEGRAEAESVETLKRKLEEVGLELLNAQEIGEVAQPVMGTGDAETREESLQELTRKINEMGVIQVTNLFLQQALRDHATDLHIEPEKEGGRLRYRINGTLHEMATLPPPLFRPVVSRIKLMAELEINERQAPQQGRISIRFNQKNYEVHVATLPTLRGESLSLKLIDPGMATDWTWDKIGFESEALREMVSPPRGLLLFVGPMGSGKTTTLYSALKTLDSGRLNIVMAGEEYALHVEGVFHSHSGLSAEVAIPALLERDVDVIALGEMESREAVAAALEAAAMNRLVLATFHAEDALHALERLRLLGIEPARLAYVLRGIVAGRLARRNCRECKEVYIPDEAIVREIGLSREPLEGAAFHRGRGCDACLGSGYKGRIALYEVLNVDDETNRMLSENPDPPTLAAFRRGKGFSSSRAEGIRRAIGGETTLEEVLRVTPSPRATLEADG